MINYKIERALFILIWIVLIYSFSLAIPPKTITPLIQYEYAVSTLILTILIFVIYHKIRNKKTRNTINRYLTSNDFELCSVFLEKCINRQPKIFWLKFQKLMMLALKGEITEFKSYCGTIKRNKNIYKKKNDETIKKFEIVFEFLIKGKIESLNHRGIQKSYLDRTVFLICNREVMSPSEIISNALVLYEAPYHLYKSISATLLANAYADLKDVNNAVFYNMKAKAYAPSNEMLYCIQSLLHANN